ncbi:MAG: trypsin-like peptidase domain-containing protein [Planctomycetota bacterium]
MTFRTIKGRDGAGSGFHIGGGRIGTARHNLCDGQGNRHPEIKVLSQGEKWDVDKVCLDQQSTKPHDVAFALCLPMKEKPRVPTEIRLPELGEEVAAAGFPKIPGMHPELVWHTGAVEALPRSFLNDARGIQVSFQSGGGLSGGCLIDKAGKWVGVMTGNAFMSAGRDANSNGESESMVEGMPERAYGQAVPTEYADEVLADCNFE